MCLSIDKLLKCCAIESVHKEGKNGISGKVYPFNKIGVKHNLVKPWFIAGLKAASRKKNLLYKNILKTNFVFNRSLI